MTIAESFDNFCGQLLFTPEIRQTIAMRQAEVTKAVTSAFREYSLSFMYAGSFGRGTATGSLRSISLLVLLPDEAYLRYDLFQADGQDQVLQDLKNSMKVHRAKIKSKGEGQLVEVIFPDGFSLEVTPVFNNEDGSFSCPDAKLGRWVLMNPVPEIEALKAADAASNGRVGTLCRMLRAWKEQNNVPIRCRLIDTLVCEFIAAGAADGSATASADKGYDALLLALFKFLAAQEPGRKEWKMVGSGDTISNKEDFRPFAAAACEICAEAIKADAQHYDTARNNKWRELFGAIFPAA